MSEAHLPHRPLRWIIAAVSLCVLLLIIGSWVYLNWKGQKDLDRHFAQLRELGFSTDLRAIYNPPIPPERDILQHPAMAAEMAKPSSERAADLFSDKKTSLMGTDLFKSFSLGSFNTSTDLTGWGNNLPEPEIARKLLQDLSAERVALKNLQPAFERPEIKFPVTWGSLGGVEYPFVSYNFLFKQAYEECFLMQLHGIAGDRQEMLASQKTILNVLRVMHSQRRSVSYLSSRFITSSFTDSLRELIRRRLLETDDLKSLLSSLAAIETDSRFKNLILGDMADSGNANQISHYALKTDIREGWEWDWEVIKMRTRGVIQAHRPAGVNASEIVSANDLIISKLMDASGRPDRHLTAEDAIELEKLSEQAPWVLIEGKFSHETGVTVLMELSAEQWHQAASKITYNLEIETRLALARIGLALELHRLEHGAYPEKLVALTPEYLPEALADPYHLDPFQYEVKPDGTLRVWSTGMDRKDPQDDLVWEVKP